MEDGRVKEKTKEILTNIFSHLGVSAGLNFDDSKSIENGRTFVNIDSDEANILIGYHGDTLNSLQHVVNTMLFKEFGQGANVLIDISGYRKERERKLDELAKSAASKARFIDKAVALYPMNSYERRIIHSKVSEIDGVTSVSEGEGYSRRVVIIPEQK